MSTTVNYKGSTIATLENETKTLTTKGTWLEDDIEIVDSAALTNVYQDEDGYVVLDKSGTASQGESNSWHRPSEWMPYASGWQNEECVYFIYDLSFYSTNQALPNFYAIAAQSGGNYLVQGGYISSSGVFTAEESYEKSSGATIDGFLPVWDGTTSSERFYAIKIYPKTGKHITSLGFTYPSSDTLQTQITGAITSYNLYNIQPCVEVYGNLPYVSNLNYKNCLQNNVLTHVNLINMTSITTLANLFKDSRALEKIDGMNTWDTSNVTALSYTFYGCSSLLDVKGLQNWDVSRVTTMANCFYYARKLKEIDLEKWEMGEGFTNFSDCFSYCMTVKKIILPKGIDGTENQANVFLGCACLEKIDFNTSFIKGNSSQFRDCNNLTSIDMSKLYHGNTTSLLQMFANNYMIKEIDFKNANTSAVTTMQDFAYQDRNLQYVDFTNCDFSAVTNTNTNMLGNCYSLIRIKGLVYYKSFNISASKMMPTINLVEVLTNLPTITTSQTITLGTDNKNKLTAEQLAIATEKGWTVA